MVSKVRYGSISIALAFAVAAFPAHAASTEPTSEQKKTARTLMVEGRALRAQNEPAKAMHKFAAADAIMHVPPTSLEFAKSQLALGLLVEAERTLVELQAIPGQADEPAQFAGARAAAASLRSDLLLRTPVITLEYSDPAVGRKSRLVVDGTPADLRQSSLRLNPGHHVLLAVNGGQRARVQVDLSEGESKPAFLDFGSNTSSARVNALDSEGGHDRASAAAPVDSGRRVSTTVYVLAGVAVAGLATGSVVGLVAKHQRSRLAQQCAPDCTPAAASQVTRMSVVSNLSLGIGLASAVGAVIAYFATPNGPPLSLDNALRSRRLQVGFASDQAGTFATVNGAF